MAQVIKTTEGIEWLRVPPEAKFALLLLTDEEMDFLFNLLDFTSLFARPEREGYDHLKNIRQAIAEEMTRRLGQDNG